MGKTIYKYRGRATYFCALNKVLGGGGEDLLSTGEQSGGKWAKSYLPWYRLIQGLEGPAVGRGVWSPFISLTLSPHRRCYYYKSCTFNSFIARTDLDVKALIWWQLNKVNAVVVGHTAREGKIRLTWGHLPSQNLELVREPMPSTALYYVQCRPASIPTLPT